MISVKKTVPHKPVDLDALISKYYEHEAELAAQAEAEGLSSEALEEIKADVEKEFDLERAAIQGEGRADAALEEDEDLGLPFKPQPRATLPFIFRKERESRPKQYFSGNLLKVGPYPPKVIRGNGLTLVKNRTPQPADKDRPGFKFKPYPEAHSRAKSPGPLPYPSPNPPCGKQPVQTHIEGKPIMPTCSPSTP